jgi:hypothetical protein
MDRKQVLSLISQHFTVDGRVTVTPDGKVTVERDVVMNNRFYKGFEKLPVEFASVGGTLSIETNNLKTLVGCPETVGGGFDCDDNELMSLEGGPKAVGRGYSCSKNFISDLKGAPRAIPGNFNCSINPLQSLEGFPSEIGGTLWISYKETLPLLRTLVAHSIVFYPWADNTDSPAGRVLSILKKYAGEGKRGVIRCQKELIAAGFEGNAKW